MFTAFVVAFCFFIYFFRKSVSAALGGEHDLYPNTVRDLYDGMIFISGVAAIVFLILVIAMFPSKEIVGLTYPDGYMALTILDHYSGPK